MLKFTYIFNFGLAGALIVPTVVQQNSSVEHLEKSIHSTEQSLEALIGIEGGIESNDYSYVDAILSSTEAPLGGARERSVLLDQLRREIGGLELQLEQIDVPVVLDHLESDPTEDLPKTTDGEVTPVETTGLSSETRDEVASIWPPIPGKTLAPAAKTDGGTFAFEKKGFTVDAVRQGRAYYRAKRYKEAMTLFASLEGEPEADYWTGRCYERLDRPNEAIATYQAVIDNEATAPELVERATADQEFLQWLIDFDRKVKDLRASQGRQS